RLTLDKTKVDRLVKTKRVQRAAQQTLLHFRRLILAGSAGRWQVRFDFFKTRMTRDFFDEICFLFHVDAPRGHRADQAFAFRGNFEIKARENTDDVRRWNREGG